MRPPRHHGRLGFSTLSRHKSLVMDNHMLSALVVCLAGLCMLQGVAGREAYGVSDRPGDVHTLIVTECSKYQVCGP